VDPLSQAIDWLLDLSEKDYEMNINPEEAKQGQYIVLFDLILEADANISGIDKDLVELQEGALGQLQEIFGNYPINIVDKEEGIVGMGPMSKEDLLAAKTVIDYYGRVVPTEWWHDALNFRAIKADDPDLNKAVYYEEWEGLMEYTAPLSLQRS